MQQTLGHSNQVPCFQEAHWIASQFLVKTFSVGKLLTRLRLHKAFVRALHQGSAESLISVCSTKGLMKGPFNSVLLNMFLSCQTNKQQQSIRASGGIGLFDKKNSNGQQKMEHESAASIHGLIDVRDMTKVLSAHALNQTSSPLVLQTSEFDQFSPM